MGSCGHRGGQSWGRRFLASLGLSFPTVQLSGATGKPTEAPRAPHSGQSGLASSHPQWPPLPPALASGGPAFCPSAPSSSPQPQPGSIGPSPLQLQLTHSPASPNCPFPKPPASQARLEDPTHALLSKSPHSIETLPLSLLRCLIALAHLRPRPNLLPVLTPSLLTALPSDRPLFKTDTASTTSAPSFRGRPRFPEQPGSGPAVC